MGDLWLQALSFLDFEFEWRWAAGFAAAAGMWGSDSFVCV